MGLRKSHLEVLIACQLGLGVPHSLVCSLDSFLFDLYVEMLVVLLERNGQSLVEVPLSLQATGVVARGNLLGAVFNIE